MFNSNQESFDGYVSSVGLPGWAETPAEQYTYKQ